MRRPMILVAIFALSLLAALPSSAQDTPWAIGLGVNGGEASPDGGSDFDLTGFTLFGRWQASNKGWGAMVEIRDGEDDEDFADFDFTQINGYATYTWRRDELVRPFIKFGLSNTEFENGSSEDDTAPIVGGGVEIGRGKWAFHAAIDSTEPEIGAVDIEVTNLTLGATLRF